MNKHYNVLLIAAPSPSPLAVISNRVNNYPPLGLCSIATYIEPYGFKTKILDLQLECNNLQTALDFIELYHPQIIGISTTTESYNCGLRIAKACKEKDSNATIVMGGAHVTFEYEDALKHTYVDIVSLREGEITFVDLCNVLINKTDTLASILGIAYRENGQVIRTKNRPLISDLNSIPYPDRGYLEITQYKRAGTVSSSRGCPGKCIFCAAGAMGGGMYRSRSAESVLQEIDYLISLGIHYIHFVDDTVTANVDRFEALVKGLYERKVKYPDFTWACESRVDIVTEDLIRWLKISGCISIQFGVESGSQKMLDSMRKGITLEEIRYAFRLAQKHEIDSACCFIIGNPDDTLETTRESIAFAEELSQMGAYIVYSISTPYPGTYMYIHAQDLGLNIFDKNWDHYTTYTSVMKTSHLSRSQIQTLFFDASTSKNINASEAHKKRTEYIRKEVYGIGR